MILDFTKMLFGKPRHSAARGTQPASPDDGVIIGQAEDGSSVLWPRPTLEHSASSLVLGASGSGKSLMCAAAFAAEIASSDSTAYAVIDPKGDIVAALVSAIAHIAPKRLRDINYLNPFSGTGFPFNLCRLELGRDSTLGIRAMQIAELVNNVSTAAGGIKHLGTGARQLDVLAHLLLSTLASDHPAANPIWTLDALTQKQGLKSLARATSSERAQQFLLSAQLSDELRSSCASRLRTSFSMTEPLERMMSTASCISLDDLTRPGALTLIDLGSPSGGMSSLRDFFSNLLCRVVIDHLLSRPSPWSGHHVRVVVDEAQLVANALSDSAEAILTTGRSRGMSLTAITQGTVLLHKAAPNLLDVLLTNTTLKIVGRLSAPDAEMLSRERAPKSGTDETIGAVRSRFAAAVCNLEDRAFFRIVPGALQRFHSADVDMEALHRATGEHEDEITAAKSRLALPPSTSRRVTLAEAFGEEPRSGRGKCRGRPRQSRPTSPTFAEQQNANAASAETNAPDNAPSAASRPRSRWG
ncbi:MAG: type IV secretory system conjugative DNA transfer family protein [Patescibacteria group bacterium]